MTKAEVVLSGDWYLLSLEGHANGVPEACAAISVLAEALDGFFDACPEEAYETVTRRLGDGSARIHVRGSDAARGAFCMTAAGLRMVEAKFPEAIRLTVDIWE